MTTAKCTVEITCGSGDEYREACGFIKAHETEWESVVYLDTTLTIVVACKPCPQSFSAS